MKRVKVNRTWLRGPFGREEGETEWINNLLKCLDHDWKDSGVPLRGAVSPAQFLRALRVLTSEALRDSGKGGDVAFLDWTLFAETATGGRPNRLLISLQCKGHFFPSVKQALWDYHAVASEEYHNLRTSFREVCRAAGSFPVFLVAKEFPLFRQQHARHDMKPVERTPFAIVETGANETALSTLVLLLEEQR